MFLWKTDQFFICVLRNQNLMIVDCGESRRVRNGYGQGVFVHGWNGITLDQYYCYRQCTCMYHVHGTRMRQEALIMIRSAANIIAFPLGMHANRSACFLWESVIMQRAHHNVHMGLWDYGNMGLWDYGTNMFGQNGKREQMGTNSNWNEWETEMTSD